MFYTLNDLSGIQYSDTDCLEIQLYVESQLALIEALMSLVKKKWVRYCGAQCPVLVLSWPEQSSSLTSSTQRAEELVWSDLPLYSLLFSVLFADKLTKGQK